MNDGRPIAVVTGARGVGFAVGHGLASAGLRVVFGVRDPVAGERAAAQIRSDVESADVTCERIDLADLASVAAFADRLSMEHDHVDVLVNNAGVVMPPLRQTTADGFEMHFGTNHLGHFALTAGLLPLLREATASRVVVVGSLAHRTADIDFDDLQAERRYRKMAAYGQSKLANLLFMVELQRRSDLAGWGLLSLGAHPGFARTEAITRPDDGVVKRSYFRMMSRLIPEPAKAARPILHAALSTEVTPTGYYGPSGPGEIAGQVGPARLSPKARRVDVAERLWAVSEQLTGVRFPAE